MKQAVMKRPDNDKKQVRVVKEICLIYEGIIERYHRIEGIVESIRKDHPQNYQPNEPEAGASVSRFCIPQIPVLMTASHLPKEY